MLRSVWFVLLPFACTFADKGQGSSGDEDTTAVAITSPANSNSGNASMPMTSPPGSNGTASQTAMQPVITNPAAVIHLSMPSNATTCTPMTFQWQVVPPSANATNIDVRLLITNAGVRQASPYRSTMTDMQPSSQQLPPAVLSHDITNRTSLASGKFNWPAVNVPEGWYILEATPVDAYSTYLASQSAQFFVMTGSNTSCVSPTISTQASASSHPGLSPGALAGTVVGSVVGIAALLGAFVLPRLWRKGVPEHLAWKAKTGGLYHVF